MKIKHVPVNLNYWHVELKVFDVLGNEVTRRVTNKWAKSSTKYILEHYLSVPLLEVPEEIKTIKQEVYTKVKKT